MAVKYSIPFYDDFNTEWRVDIDLPNYLGPALQLTGVGRVFCQPEWSAGDDPYEPIVNSKVTIQFYNRAGEVDVQELQQLDDMAGRVVLYKTSVLWWTGYIIPDGIQRMLQPHPYPITITATDGLALLKDVPFRLQDNWPMPAGVSGRSPMSFIRYILYGFSGSHLNIQLPIRFECGVKSILYDDSALMGTMQWGALGDAWEDLNGNPRSCEYILEGLLKALQCRIMQFGGKWHIIRINDIVDGEYNWTELSVSSTTAPVVTTGTEDLIGEYQFVNENQVATLHPAYSTVKAVYNHYQAENILPNGGMDVWPLGSLQYWGFRPTTGAIPVLTQSEPLRADGIGHAARLANLSAATADAEFSYIFGLPIDANVLFKRFVWGFTIMPTKKGFTYNENEVVDWSNNPLRVSVEFGLSNGVGAGVRYVYLNEFGYWQSEARGLELGVFFMNVQSAYIGLNAMSHAIYFQAAAGGPNVGDVLTVGIRRNPGDAHRIYSFTVTLAEEGNLEFALNALLLVIKAGEGRIASEQVIMTDASNGRIQFQDLSVYGQPNGSTYKSGATQQFQYIFPKIDNIHTDEAGTIVFRGRGGNEQILIPDPDILENGVANGVSSIVIKFYVKPGQEYVLDDVYMRIDNNNDVYESSMPAATKKTNRKDVDLQISSSFSGFMLSNLMTTWSQSDAEFRFTDGKYNGGLTGMTANAMMRFHNKPSEVFDGDLFTAGQDWKAHHIYQFSGKKYLPLVSRYNIETGIVSLSAIECRDDENTFDQKHYGSNEKILSNT